MTKSRHACTLCGGEAEWQRRDRLSFGWWCPNHNGAGYLSEDQVRPLFVPGDVVTVSYTGYTTECLVIKPYVNRYSGTSNGWWVVEELRNSRGTDYLDEEYRPRYEAADEFMVARGDDPAPGPFSAEFFLRTLG